MRDIVLDEKGFGRWSFAHSRLPNGITAGATEQTGFSL
jgi:hypothetical protein